MSIRHGLLAPLSGGARYGYQLRVEFEASTGATWPLNIGQVYTTLSRVGAGRATAGSWWRHRPRTSRGWGPWWGWPEVSPPGSR
ncbi:PadR family transcriptional regulator [Nonomuraea cypriaca]|uniref:PadR family transcriptional regulator n=1 Tax=Nonomuraea cypriaca TaxID=1187855 RepID=UPI0038B324AE